MVSPMTPTAPSRRQRLILKTSRLVVQVMFWTLPSSYVNVSAFEVQFESGGFVKSVFSDATDLMRIQIMMEVWRNLDIGGHFSRVKMREKKHGQSADAQL